MSERIVIGEDRYGNRQIATIAEAGEDPHERKPRFPCPAFEVEVRGTTFQNRPGRKHMMRVYADGREEQIL